MRSVARAFSAADRGLVTWTALGLASAAAWAVLAAWTPPDDAAWTPCLFRRVTHLDCPGCGLTRAFALIAKGHVTDAFARHPLAPPLAAQAALLWLAAPLAMVRDWRPSQRAVERLLLGNVAVLLAVWLARLVAGLL